MATELDGAREKLRRGRHHAAMFGPEFRRLYGPDAGAPFTIKTEFNAKKGCFHVRIDTLEERQGDLPLILGDALHNFRSALDHVAWQLARRQQGRQPRSLVSFPICEGHERFNSRSVWTHLWEIGPSERATIENLQPYRQVFTGDLVHPLTLLSACNNKDKHRLLHVIVLSNKSFSAKVADWRDCKPTRMVPLPSAVDHPLKPNMEILRVMAEAPGPRPVIDVEASGTYIPLLDDGSILPVGTRLDRIGEAVDNVIRSFEPIF
jgi:hypothetical protein